MRVGVRVGVGEREGASLLFQVIAGWADPRRMFSHPFREGREKGGARGLGTVIMKVL